MQEPQYRAPGVRELLDAVAKAKVPCMSIMTCALPTSTHPGPCDRCAQGCLYGSGVWDSSIPP